MVARADPGSSDGDDAVLDPAPPATGPADGARREAAGLGAAAGLAGAGGAFAWARRASTRRAVDAVSPGTARGAFKVLAWLVAIALIGVLGRSIAPGLGIVWLAIALGLMIPLAAWWPRRHEPRG